MANIKIRQAAYRTKQHFDGDIIGHTMSISIYWILLDLGDFMTFFCVRWWVSYFTNYYFSTDARADLFVLDLSNDFYNNCDKNRLLTISQSCSYITISELIIVKLQIHWTYIICTIIIIHLWYSICNFVKFCLRAGLPTCCCPRLQHISHPKNS